MSVMDIETQVSSLFSEIAEEFRLNQEKLLVVGCSTSEIMGKHIGKAGSETIAETVLSQIEKVREKYGFSIAIQCCEHLNRSLIIERSTLNRYMLTEVSVKPSLTAGGALPTKCYGTFKDPVVVESITADAGVDIGDTFIGMHIRHVAVPFRTKVKEVGEAHVTSACSRPKLIGGERACYS